LAEVRLQDGESIESALRRFKRKVQTEDIIKEVKRHSYYLKPGAKRRVKQALARKRARKKIRNERDWVASIGSLLSKQRLSFQRTRFSAATMKPCGLGSENSAGQFQIVRSV
jgi:small subunit ribosomal protein S21